MSWNQISIIYHSKQFKNALYNFENVLKCKSTILLLDGLVYSINLSHKSL